MSDTQFDYKQFNHSADFDQFGCQNKDALNQAWILVFNAIAAVTPNALLFWVMENDAALFMRLPDAANLSRPYFGVYDSDDDSIPGWPFELWETYRIVLTKSLTMGGSTFRSDIDSIFAKLNELSLNCFQTEKCERYLSVTVATLP